MNAVDSVFFIDADSDQIPPGQLLRVAVVTGNEQYPGDSVYFTTCANDEGHRTSSQEVLATFCVHLEDLVASINLLAEGRAGGDGMTAQVFSRTTTARDRLLARLVPQPNGCWHWTGVIDKDGYGRIGYKGVRGVPVQRAAYDCLVGPIPDGQAIDHTCHTEDGTCPGGPDCLHRRCGNPDHLQPVPMVVNTQRGGNTRKTECPHGHEYTEANTYRHGGRRYCVTCYTLRHGSPPRKAVAS